MFTEELEKVNLKLVHAQEQQHAAEREKNRLADELRSAKHEAGELAALVEARDSELLGLRRQVQEARATADKVAVLEQDLSEALSLVRDLEVEAGKSDGKIAKLKSDNQGLRDQNGAMLQELTELRKDAEVTRRLVTAVRESVELDSVIENETQKLLRKREVLGNVIAADVAKLGG